MNKALIDYYRCPENFAEFTLISGLSDTSGFFRFGHDAICFGQSSSGFCAKRATDPLHDALEDVTVKGSTPCLPFDPTQVIDNLRRERYTSNARGPVLTSAGRTIIRKAYYFLRPLMPASVRRPIQQIYFRGRGKIYFPKWPVDRTVEHILERLLVLSMTANRTDQIPFIWFWPDGALSCAMITHDVETQSGRDFCSHLMDIDDSFQIKASFQIVPEKRYKVPQSLLESIRNRGFELGIQDLNHDGRLFTDREEFLRRAERINLYAKEYGASGFRAAVLYRNADWYDALAFSYDMSIPNVAHLDAQQGGCCTVMPYFIGGMLELPVTTTQDYSLFRILNDYSIELWKQQIALIMDKHGLISFIVHPDYVIEKRARNTYVGLLECISALRSEGQLWVALPREVDSWWRERSRMKVIRQGDIWIVDGPGKERARMAYANLRNGHLSYALEPNG